MYEVFELILGFVILLFGGEFLVRGAISFAKLFNVSPLVIGLTVVSFGTSAPELLVSLQAALMGSPDLAIGNVVGSNIANLALVLGITIIILPMIIDKSNLFVNWVVMVLATLLFSLFSFTDYLIVFWEGIVLFALLVVYLLYFFISAKNDKVEELEEDAKTLNIWWSLFFFIAGSAGLYFGSELLVSNAVIIAVDYLGCSQAVIGVTIVAFGTSLPELVASVLAAFRKQSGISIGNLIGSNIFNLLAVIGVTSIITPVDVFKSFFDFDFYWLLIISFLMGPLLLVPKKIGRLIGTFLFVFYVCYIILVV